MLQDQTTTTVHSGYQILGFPGGSVVKNLPANAGRHGFDPWVREIPWRRKWQPTPVLLPGKSHGQRGIWQAPGVAKESDTAKQLSNNKQTVT